MFRGAIRRLHWSPALRQKGSLFGDFTKAAATQPVKVDAEASAESEGPTQVRPADDKPLQQFYLDEALKYQFNRDKFVSPIKRRLFDLNVAQHGFYKNNQLIVDPESNKTHQLVLTAEEIEVLEPSVYVESLRIKSSMKKATVVNRFVRGWDVKAAINQLHFNPKKMSTQLEKLLKLGLEQAEVLGLDTDSLYIHSLWTGSDGNWFKRVDPKGRGRMGIIKHPYIHLKAVLKTKQTRDRVAWEKAEARKLAKPSMPLVNEPLNFKVRPYYKW